MGNAIILSVLYCEAFKLCLGLDDAWKATQSSAVRQENNFTYKTEWISESS